MVCVALPVVVTLVLWLCGWVLWLRCVCALRRWSVWCGCAAFVQRSCDGVLGASLRSEQRSVPGSETASTSWWLRTKGVFSHSARTAPIITVIIQVTTLKTTHLRNHAQSIQNSKIQTSNACHGSQGAPSIAAAIQ